MIHVEDLKAGYDGTEVLHGITLHVETLHGENNHHMIESCYKGLARALKAAVAIDPRQADRVPSTKGQLGD